MEKKIVKPKNKWKTRLAALGVVSTLTIAVVSPEISRDYRQPVGGVSVVQDCLGSDVKLRLTEIEEVCLTEQDYSKVKTELLNEYEKGGNYDFDINNLEILGAVLNREVGLRGGLSVTGGKEDLEKKLIDLLR